MPRVGGWAVTHHCGSEPVFDVSIFLSLETGWRPICGDTIQRTEASRAASSMSPWRHLAAVHAHSWLCALGIMASSHHTGSSPSGATLEIEFEEEQEETSGEEEPSI